MRSFFDAVGLAFGPKSASADRVTPFPWTDLVIIAGLIVLNGVFAMSELAIVSARTGTLQTRAQKGNRAAQTALELAADPGKFLSTVQIGITRRQPGRAGGRAAGGGGLPGGLC